MCFYSDCSISALNSDLMLTLAGCSAHTQSTAYQIGMIAAEKLIEEYDLSVARSRL